MTFAELRDTQTSLRGPKRNDLTAACQLSWACEYPILPPVHIHGTDTPLQGRRNIQQETALLFPLSATKHEKHMSKHMLLRRAARTAHQIPTVPRPRNAMSPRISTHARKHLKKKKKETPKAVPVT